MATTPELTQTPPPGRSTAGVVARYVRAHAVPATLAIALVALFARIVSYPLQHDEQFYVSAGILFGFDDLYPRMGFSHLPNLPILLHLLYAAPIGEHYLLIARLIICVTWAALLLSVVLLGRHLGADRLMLLMMTVLLVTNPLLLGPTGMTATNNMLPMPFALFGLLMFLRGVAAPRARPMLLVLSGMLLALAAGFKINYAVLVLPFGAAAFLLPRELSWRQRLARVALPMLVGGLVGALPTLIFLFQDPAGLFAHVVTYQRGPQISYWLAHADPRDPKIIDPRGKILLAEQLWLSGATMVLVMTLAFLVVLRVRSSEAARADERPWQVWLIAALVGLGAALAFIPTPAFPQYYTLPIPFALPLLAALYGAMDEKRRTQARPLLVVGTLIAALAGAPMLLSALPSSVRPNRWTGIQVHADARKIAHLVNASRSDAPIATLGPLYALEGGRTVYLQLALGPFIYRAADYVPAALGAHFTDMVSPTTIGAFLAETCPSAVLVGLEGELDEPLAHFARDHRYVAQPIRLHAAERSEGWLLVRPGSRERGCAGVPQLPASEAAR